MADINEPWEKTTLESRGDGNTHCRLMMDEERTGLGLAWLRLRHRHRSFPIEAFSSPSFHLLPLPPSPVALYFPPLSLKQGTDGRTDGRTDAGTHMPRTRTHAHVRKRTDGRMLARCFSPSSGEQTRNGATHLGSRAETPFRDTFF